MDRLKFSALIFGVLTAVAFARPTNAADHAISFFTPASTIRPGDTVMIDVLLTSTGQAANAVELTLHYPAGVFRVDEISRQQSALQLWPTAPTWDAHQGTIHVIGGTPNGMFASNARLFTIVGTALQTGTIEIALDSTGSGMYLNDGLGTKTLFAPVNTTFDVSSEFVPQITISSPTHPNPQQWYAKNSLQIAWAEDALTQYSYSFSADGLTPPTDNPSLTRSPLTLDHLADGRYAFLIKSRPNGGSWGGITQRWFLIDSTPPEAFRILHPDPSTVGNANIISWSPVDRMSGIDHSVLAVDGKTVGAVTSPLHLQTAWAGKVLAITVYDQAGNSQKADWLVPGKKLSLDWLIVGVMLLLGCWLGWHYRRRVMQW